MASKYNQPKYIYGLVDPRDGKVRYVGGSEDPFERYKGHVNKVDPPSWDMVKWLDELEALGLRPDIRLFTKKAVSDWAEVERAIQDEYGATILDKSGRQRSIRREYTREEIASTLKEAREAANISASEAAASLYVSPATISRWENGQRAPSINSLMEMAQVYGTSVASLLPMNQSEGAAADAARAKE